MTEIIGIKELYRNLNKISLLVKEGEIFTVVKRSKPIFQIIPYDTIEKKHKYNLESFRKLYFKGNKKLSRQIDKVIYN